MADTEADMNGDAPMGGGVVRSELEELQMQSNQVTDEKKSTDEEQENAKKIPILLNQSATSRQSLESTRRMLAMCEESKDAGIRTLVMLDEQGETLEQKDAHVDLGNQYLLEAEKNFDDMEKCCGLFTLPWKSGKNFEKGSEYANTWNKDDDGKVNTDGPRVVVGDQGGFQGQMITRITKDAREDEMEQNMTEVSGMITNLRNMAVDMGSEIEGQNRQIDRINQKAGSLDTRVQDANRRANKILKNK